MASSSDIQNRCYKALVELTAFTDLALLNTGLPLVLRTAFDAELRFYTTQCDYEDYELIGHSSAQLTRNNPRRVSASSPSLAITAAQLGGDRTLFNKLGCRNFLACTSATGARSLFQQIINTEQKVFVIVNGALVQEQIDFVRAGLQIYANQVKLLKRTIRDSLTNLLNRDAFERRMRSLYSRNSLHRRRSGEHTCNGCFAIADIDNFKRVNDTYGHVYGDKVLILFAQIMRDSFRDEDVLCRFGGEEFVIVLSDTDVIAAIKALQRFKDTVAATEFPQDVAVTVSIGFTQLNLELPLDVMTARADKALYYAKTHGRNKLCHYEDLIESEKLEHNAELFA